MVPNITYTILIDNISAIDTLKNILHDIKIKT